MNQRLIGLVVGSVFGAVFVLVNAQPPLPPGSVAALQVAAVAWLAALVVLGVLAARRSARSADSPAGPAGAAESGAAPRRAMFGRWYLLVVAAEVVLLFAGFPLLRALGAPGEANVAWIALVVGVHFFALAAVWKAPSVTVPGAGLSLMGASGLRAGGNGNGATGADRQRRRLRRGAARLGDRRHRRRLFRGSPRLTPADSRAHQKPVLAPTCGEDPTRPRVPLTGG